ncbi:hypothetical protein OC835_004578 [Tilletia horrida]|nr:hypothetical protein OC835_004578 [Tilletia horrida]
MQGSEYSGAELTYAPEVAYMGSAYYSVPQHPQHISRLQPSPPKAARVSGGPNLGISTTTTTPSPSASSPNSTNRTVPPIVETDAPSPQSAGRRQKGARAGPHSNATSRPAGLNTKPGSSPSVGATATSATVGRSEHVMWVGNVPQDATVKELYEVFSQIPSAEAVPPSSNSDNPTVKAPTETQEQAKPALFKIDYASTPSSSIEESPLVAEGEAEEPPSKADPLDATAAESAPGTDSHGIISIFPISRSNCAFVNYATAEHLARAVPYFSGRPVRSQDKRCLPMICRIRKKDDEERAGVAGQRGRGMHVEWVKEHERKRKAAVAAAKRSEDAASDASAAALDVPSIALSVPNASETTTPTPAESMQRTLASGLPVDSPESNTPRIAALQLSGGTRLAEMRYGMVHDNSSSSIETSSNGSLSYTSTNSSVLRHPAFKVRYFILKSRTREDLEQSLHSGLWATQSHNEGVLDQAYRLSATVILIFGANQSGEFFGYAQMAGPIRPNPGPPSNSSGSGGSNSSNSRLSVTAGPSSRLSPVGGLPVMMEEAAEQSRPGGGVAGLADTSESIEASRSGSILEAWHLPPGPPMPFGQAEGSSLEPPHDPSCMASPLQLTPAEEEVSSEPMLHIGDNVEHPSTWPSASTDAAPKMDLDSSRRGATLSPKLLSQAHRPSIYPIPPSSGGHDANHVHDHSSLNVQPPERSVSDSGYRATPFSSSDNEAGNSSDTGKAASARAEVTSPNLSNHSSLGPHDSASYDPRAAQQLAMRAIIHNLRLDERESLRKAEELEKQLRLAEAQAEDDPLEPTGEGKGAVLPPASSTPAEPLGRSFAVKWLQTKPLPFRRVQHLRNPWRDNRQIKVSRDGTELEPSVGDQLVAEWERFVSEEPAPAPVTKQSGTVGKEDETVEAEEED